MRATDRRPPLIAATLIAAGAPPELRDQVVGDLLEEFRRLAEIDPVVARVWYRRQVALSLGTFALWRLEASPVTRALGAWAAGSLAAVIAAISLGLVLDSWLGRVPSQESLALIGGVGLCALISSTCASYVTTRIYGQPGRWLLLAVGLVVVAPELIQTALSAGSVAPLWLALPLLMAGLMARSGVLLGHRLGAAPRARPSSTGELQ